MKDRLRLVQEVAHRRDVGAPERRAARGLRCQLGRDPNPGAGIVDPQSVRTTGVGGNGRGGFDPAKKVEGWTRHLLVDTEGLLLGVRIYSARVPDADGSRLLPEQVRGRFARLSHLWVGAGHQGRGRKRAEEAMGPCVEVVRKPLKPGPEKMAGAWARERARADKEVDWRRLMPQRGLGVRNEAYRAAASPL